MSIPSIFSDDTEPTLSWVTPTQEWKVRLTVADDLEFIDQATSTTVLTLGPTGVVTFGNFSFPSTDGTSGQVLRTDGAGTLIFVDAIGIGDLISANNLSDVANTQTAIDNLTKTSTVEVDVLALADHGANSQVWTIEEDSTVATNAITFDYAGAERLRLAPNGTMTFSVPGVIKGFDASSEISPGGPLTILGGAGDFAVGGTITVQGGAGGDSNDGGDVLIVPGTSGVEEGGPGSVVISGLTWPATDGTAGQPITTDGSGNLSFSDGFTGFDIAFFVGSTPASSQISGQFIAVRDISFPVNLTGSAGVASTAATASTDFDIQKNGGSIGTMNFDISATVATFTFASPVAFTAGDILKVIAPGSPDATLADISMTFKGTRT